MPIPKRVGRWNKAGLNRVVRHIAPLMPGMAVLVHRGRRSGREYQIPVLVFRTEDGFIIALTYGPDTDWMKNVQAAGGCELRTRGRVVRVGQPRVYHDESRRGIGPVQRQVLRLIGVADFLSLKTVPPGQVTLALPAPPVHIAQSVTRHFGHKGCKNGHRLCEVGKPSENWQGVHRLPVTAACPGRRRRRAGRPRATAGPGRGGAPAPCRRA
jgi:deazaflavin-dependent oxidoreductase (nitroreductase family)